MCWTENQITYNMKHYFKKKTVAKFTIYHHKTAQKLRNSEGCFFKIQLNIAKEDVIEYHLCPHNILRSQRNYTTEQYSNFRVLNCVLCPFRIPSRVSRSYSFQTSFEYVYSSAQYWRNLTKCNCRLRPKVVAKLAASRVSGVEWMLSV